MTITPGLPSPSPTQLPGPTDLKDTPPVHDAGRGPFTPIVSWNEPLRIDTHLKMVDDDYLWVISREFSMVLDVKTGTITRLDYLSPAVFAGLDDVGGFWVIPEDGSAIHRRDGSEWTIDTLDPPVSCGMGCKVILDHDQRPWVLEENGLRFLEEGSWRMISFSDIGFQPSPLSDFIPDFRIHNTRYSHQIWVSECDWIGPGPGGGRGVRWLEGDTWMGEESPLNDRCVTAVEEAPSGDIWVGADNGIWRYDPEEKIWLQISYPEPPPEYNRVGFVTDMRIDPDGEPWLPAALCGGASCFSETWHLHYPQGEWKPLGGLDRGVRSWFVFDKDGTPIQVLESGIYRMENNQPVRISDIYVWDVVTSPNGRILLGGVLDGDNKLWVYNIP
jgi:hypothetical protein